MPMYIQIEMLRPPAMNNQCIICFFFMKDKNHENVLLKMRGGGGGLGVANALRDLDSVTKVQKGVHSQTTQCWVQVQDKIRKYYYKSYFFQKYYNVSTSQVIFIMIRVIYLGSVSMFHLMFMLFRCVW